MSNAAITCLMNKLVALCNKFGEDSIYYYQLRVDEQTKKVAEDQAILNKYQTTLEAKKQDRVSISRGLIVLGADISMIKPYWPDLTLHEIMPGTDNGNSIRSDTKQVI